MKKLLILSLFTLLFSCKKEEPKSIQGDWFCTRLTIEYDNGNDYDTYDYSWSDVIYTNTESIVYVYNDPMEYSIVDNNTIYILDLATNADIEYLDNPKHGFDLLVDDPSTEIKYLRYSYRKSK